MARKNERFMVGVLRIAIEMSGMDDLKAKRSVVARVKDRVRDEYPNVSIAEVGSQDVYDEAIFGLSAVSNDSDYLRSIFQKIPDFIDTLGVARVTSEDVDIQQY